MPLHLQRLQDEYFGFIERYNQGEGICVGISMVWIERKIEGAERIDSPVDDDLGLKKATLYQRNSLAACAGKSHVKRLEWLGRKLDEAYGDINIEVKESKSKVFSSSKNNENVKNKMKNYLADKGKDIAFILFFDSLTMDGHAIAVFQPAGGAACYVYDPNVGVYLWRSGGRDLCDELEEHFLLEEQVKYFISAGLFVKSW
ncbi:YopT-type cysteine protease domain-containing protein [Enterobacter cloacae]|uniref:YopT-type cysteine protease domain-containing protein n=1 Tax=Enterobacter cloacae TaxID=550 RepID=UPI00101B1EF8|nr:YopT-type cysteine protease domain-containing protein [Enterobacter cloacae]QBC03353.1 hypothetical protein EWI30_15230 [Enterobacter cloacae]